MNWEGIITGIVSFAGGSAGMAIINSILQRKKNNVDFGMGTAKLYNEIDAIVEKKTKPIQDKLDHAIREIDTLKRDYCCFRDNCKYRIRSQRDKHLQDIITDIKDEAENIICKPKKGILEQVDSTGD